MTKTGISIRPGFGCFMLNESTVGRVSFLTEVNRGHAYVFWLKNPVLLLVFERSAGELFNRLVLMHRLWLCALRIQP